MQVVATGASNAYNELMRCVVNGDEETALALLSEQPSIVFDTDRKGRTALDWARMCRSQRFVQLILPVIERQTKQIAAEATGQIQLSDKEAIELNRTLMMRMQVALQDGDRSRLNSLVQSAEAVACRQLTLTEPKTSFANAEIESGDTPLIVAVKHFDTELLHSCIQCGADVNFQTRRGHTALAWACVSGNLDAFKVITMNGGRLDQSSGLESYTALHYACLYRRVDIVKFIVSTVFDRVDDQFGAPEHGANKQNQWAARIAAVDIYLSARDWKQQTPQDLLSQVALQNGSDTGALTEDIQQILQQACQRLHHWKCLDEEERQLGFIQCEFGCGFHGHVEDVFKHQASCVDRPVICALCGLRVDAHIHQKHVKSECPRRPVTCPIDGCDKELTAEQLEHHTQHECLYRSVKCRLGCGESIPYIERYDHEQGECVWREILCKCGQALAAQDLGPHLYEECALRTVECRLGCGLKLLAADRQQHEEEECIQPCKWGCGLVVGPADRRAQHEALHCEKRLVTCPNGCGMEGLTAEVLEAHQQFQCSNRNVLCRHCSSTLPNASLRQHLDSWSGTCPGRLMRCPRDCVGRRVSVGGKWGVILQAKLPQADNSRSRLATADIQYLIRFTEGHAWVSTHDSSCHFPDGNSDSPHNKSWLCGWIPSKQLRRHMETQCTRRQVEVDGQRIQASDLDVFQQSKAEHEDHMTVKVTTVQCTDCLAQIDQAKLREHQFSCAEKLLRCTLGCGKMLRQRFLQAHVLSECPKRDIKCQNCNAIVWAEEHERHLEKQCPKRLIQCQLCSVPVAAVDMEIHKQATCMQRICVCECGLEVTAANMDDHRAIDCEMKISQCPQGCGVEIPRRQLEEHMRGECKYRERMENRLTLCPLRCGLHINRIRLAEHIANECQMRIYSCSNCHLNIRYSQLAVHETTCLARKICCSPNEQGCARTLGWWLNLADPSSTASGAVLRQCEMHGGTALIHAVKARFLELATFILAVTGGRGIDLVDAHGDSALTSCCGTGDMLFIELLVNSGADVNLETHLAKTPLIQAVKAQSLAAVEFLVSKQTRVDYTTAIGQSALHWAKRLNLSMIVSLLQLGSTVDRQVTTLFRAIRAGDMHTVQLLTDGGEPFQPAKSFAIFERQRKIETLLETLDAELEELKQFIAEEETTYYPLNVQADVARQQIQECRREAHEAAQTLYELPIAVKSKRETYLKLCDTLTIGDIEEVLAQAHPSKLTSCCMMAFGYIAGLLTAKNAAAELLCARPARSSWWQNVCNYLRSHRTSCIERLRTMNFSRMLPSITETVHSLWGVAKSVGAIDVLRAARRDTQANIANGQDGEEVLESFFVVVLASLAEIVSMVYQHGETETQRQQRYKAIVSKLLITEKENFEVINRYNASRLRLQELEKMRVDKLKRHQVLKAEVIANRNKLRVTKLLGTVTTSGHTAISWAASLGDVQVVQHLLANGATLGYCDLVLHMAAVVVQLTFRMKKAWVSAETVDLATVTDLKRKFGTAQRQFYLSRTKHRLPIPEAIFAGNYELLEELYTQSALHAGGFVTCITPHAGVPFSSATATETSRFSETKTSLGLLDCHQLGQQFCDWHWYDPSLGWIHMKQRYETQMHVLQQLLQERATLRVTVRTTKQRARNRMLAIDRAQKAEVLMHRAIEAHDFDKVLELALEGSSINLRTPTGLTALMAAVEADQVIAPGHEKGVLAVQYLMDNAVNPPDVNVTNAEGMTAALLACALGRLRALEFLLDHGASVQHCDSRGMNGLMHAAKKGHGAVVLMMLERGADWTVTDSAGHTAADYAEQEGFTEVSAIISQYSTGMLGPVKKARGKVSTEVPCVSGCGSFVELREMPNHLANECLLREIECSFGCGIQHLLARDEDIHKEQRCKRRLMNCRLCGTLLAFEERASHELTTCEQRVVNCPYKCGSYVTAAGLAQHQALCDLRPTKCSSCGAQIHFKDKWTHATRICPMRKERCRHGCGGVVLAKQQLEHETNTCPCRPVECEWCGQQVQYQSLVHHQAASCSNKHMPCPQRCGASISIRDSNAHLYGECPNRFELCPNDCGMKVRMCDVESHLRKECSLRVVQCPSCEKEVISRLFEIHQRIDCSRRPVPCSQCTEPVPAHELQHHKQLSCSQRLVSCRLPGCVACIPFADREHHEAHQCQKRRIWCPQGCEEAVIAEGLTTHIETKCRMRMVNCKLGCGARLRACEHAQHLEQECPRRYEDLRSARSQPSARSTKSPR